MVQGSDAGTTLHATHTHTHTWKPKLANAAVPWSSVTAVAFTGIFTLTPALGAGTIMIGSRMPLFWVKSANTTCRPGRHEQVEASKEEASR